MIRRRKHEGVSRSSHHSQAPVLELRALKRSISSQIRHLIDEEALSKTELAIKMRTSRTALDRLLDAKNTSVTLNTLDKAAHALGRRLKIELISG